MLEKPDVQDECIVATLESDYGLQVLQVDFLPFGADENTASYRVALRDAAPCFLKLRRGVFDESSLLLLDFLCRQGIAAVIPPRPAKTAQLWVNLGAFKVTLYPFVEGRNGYEVVLSEQNWRSLGEALWQIHAVDLPPVLRASIRRETYSARWRASLRVWLKRVETDEFEDTVAAALAAFLAGKRDQVLDLAVRAERLATMLQTRMPPCVLCHADIHAGNVLIDASDALFIVDWDSPILAPKERDLMYIGGAQGFIGRTASEEEELFYRGYGKAQVDPAALAYYRYERIVEDIVVFCQQLLATSEGGQDRAQALRYVMSNFLPGGTIEIARQSDRTTVDEWQ